MNTPTSRTYTALLQASTRKGEPMIDTEYAEPADVGEVKDIAHARTTHKCSACGETIRIGAPYTRLFYVYGGDATVIKRCRRCEAIHAHLREVGDEYPDNYLDCGHTYEEIFGHAPPPEIAELAFAI